MLEQRLIYANHLSYALNEIETILIFEAHNYVEVHGLEPEFTKAMVHVLHERFYNLFVHQIACFRLDQEA
ncbi:hypothetical protein [Exiguobacterium artemiae]|uniref:hypothetical protein n=1 Tax=Exiguobacterium artemiae TaxID=340145 RepID=UPI003CFC245C